mmetsp:Transcript_2219/g.3845  ORF Transcript_2219/g.3845 Transcript_2219/m.3845 type:complete len:104 (+) Transcript_2219:137-448(+)
MLNLNARQKLEGFFSEQKFEQRQPYNNEGTHSNTEKFGSMFISTQTCPSKPQMPNLNSKISFSETQGQRQLSGGAVIGHLNNSSTASNAQPMTQLQKHQLQLH